MPNRFQVNQHDLAYNFLAAYEKENKRGRTG